VIIDSNNRSVVPASPDERRYAVLKVSDIRRKDYDYFAALDNQLNHGGTEALMYELKSRDISKFNHRAAPSTMWLTEQVLENMSDLDRWLLGIVRLGQIKFITSEKDSEFRNGWIIVGRQILYDTYCRAMKARGSRAKVLNIDEFGRQLRPLVPKIVDGKIVKSSIIGRDWKLRGEKIESLIGEKRIGKDETGGRMWCHIFPPLAIVREALEFRLGELDWNTVTEWEPQEYEPF
jgi:hypothetical protein